MLRIVGAVLAATLIPFAIDAAVADAVPSPQSSPASGRGGEREQQLLIPPHEAARYQRDLTRNARLVWGLEAPVATFGAQIHQESRWRLDARSAVGAQGIAQFMPATSSWISGLYPSLGDNQPSNPAWAMRALVTYDRHLWDRVQAADTCARMAMTLSAYNGGLGWVYRDQKLAEAKTLNPAIWFGQVEKVNAGRAPAMFAENRGYPRVILLKWQPVYAVWGGEIKCG